MRFDILTLFPGLVETVLGESIIGRAQKSGAISVFTHNIRDYSRDRRRRVDDTPYGGGKGMLIAAPPIVECHEAVKSEEPGLSCHTIYMSPRGKVLTHKKAAELAGYERLIILCGHYEGIDNRALELISAEEISIGDYVLTGGEIPACILVDCVSRLCPGVLSDEECHEKESVASGFVEYPQYTRPPEYRGLEVPEVLKNGNHAEIERWRYRQSVDLTLKMRPDLLGVEYMIINDEA